MIKKIEYENKVSIQNDESIENKNKVTDSDMNEIKEIVNNNANELSTVEKDINDIKSKNTEQDTKIATNETNIKELQTDNTTNKQDISNIKIKNTEQDKYIAEIEAENSRLREDLNGLPKGQASGETIDLNDSAEMRCELKIGGNSKQETRSGKNKLLNDKPTGTLNGVTFTRDNSGIITANGTATDAIVCYLGSKFKTIEAGTYKLSDGRNDESNSTYFTYMDCYNTDGSAYQNGNLSTVGTSAIKYTEPKMIKGRIVIRKGTTLNNIVFKPQLELVNSIDDKSTDYEQYGASPSPDYPSEVECCGDNGSINEVICNKNRLDKNNYRLGYISSTGGFVANNSVALFDYISVKPNTVLTFSQQKNYEYRYCYYDENKKFIYRSDAFTTKTSEITIPDNVNYIVFFINFGVSSITQDIIDEDKIQVEEGSTTDYVEHKEQTYTIPTQQPFRAIRNIRDTFIKKNNKWYERHYIARKIFDGTENWKKSSTYSGGFYFNWSEFDRSGKHFSEFYCNYAKYVSTSDEYRNNIGVCYSDASCSIRTTDGSNINTVELWKAYLQEQYNAGTPVYVDYISSEPLDIECTEEQSTILWDIEQNAKTYDKVTHMYSTDNVSPNVEITYKKDIETLFANTLIEEVG